MLPGFALNLSHTGISLLKRADGGWHVLGDASLASSRLGDDLKALRAKARRQPYAPFLCKLVIPNSEVLYTEVEAPGPTDAERLVQIRAALEGLTPYSVDELAFDWRLKGERAQVAAVAQMTLREAEGFALEHNFPPACFVAIPEAGAFDGEPFFGLPHTRPADLVVERDPEAIRILPHEPAAPSAPAAKPAPQAEPEPPTEQQDPADTKDPTPPPDAEDVPAPDTATGPSPEVQALAASLAPRFSFVAEAPADPAPEASGGDASAPQPGEEAADDAEAGVPAFVRAAESLTPAAPIATPAPAPTPAPSVTATADVALVAAQDDLAPQEAPQPLRKPDDPFPLPAFPAAGEARSGLGRKLLPIAGLAACVALLLVGVRFLNAPAAVDMLRVEAPTAAQTPADETANIDLAALPESDGAALLEPALVEGAETESAAAPAGDGSGETAGPDPVVLASLPEASAPVLLQEAPDAAAPADDAAAAPPAQEAGPETAGAPLAEAEGPRLNLLQGPGSTDSLYIASIDPQTEGSDAVALPGIDSFETDAPLAARSNPADAATQFALDENGWVVPTTEGALTPDGVRVFAGAPPRPSTPRPEGLAPVDLLAEADPLAGFRPAARPADLVENDERNRLGGRTLAQLATLRPVPRPNDALAVAAALADAQEAAEAEADAFDLPTERAVARSPLPRPRPEIETRRVAAVAPTATAPAPKPAPKPAPQAETGAEETGGRTTGQRLSRQEINSKTKTAASVAQQATLKNAMNLGKINLIGVYGSDKNRRALIRLSSGRYVKVKVGDRVDGGQVASIGSSELRYIKSGRNITLKMPKG
ncbi:Type IV pilus biogenesis [Pseudoruegeria aquimaris]|uniref:Type IV pilus biogenesis n=1 Tax=Pseudoruegeria aquimaris TaxID=393663 RepID=A0A1Y5SAN2_9RHOB|nr:hypothetical protein [Pseudoruegeria aquimaris]SLN33763.1 Type IV pilus biogenesis [Pseudoruegeria aquimaris]